MDPHWVCPEPLLPVLEQWLSLLLSEGALDRWDTERKMNWEPTIGLRLSACPVCLVWSHLIIETAKHPEKMNITPFHCKA